MRFREVKQIASSHTADKWQIGDTIAYMFPSCGKGYYVSNMQTKVDSTSYPRPTWEGWELKQAIVEGHLSFFLYLTHIHWSPVMSQTLF